VPNVVVRMLALHTTPADAYARISDFPRYVELTDAVREVVLHPPGLDGRLVSEWTVRFRKGLLRWTERDTFDPVNRVIEFEQITGDFASFTGSWRMEAAAENSEGTDGTEVTFEAQFDLGIPTLADLLDPVAESTLRANIVLILHGLLGVVVPVDPNELAGALS
jgi:ribosome-associated toxin RatA of RatAB toxin-antitoxin module